MSENRKISKFPDEKNSNAKEYYWDNLYLFPNRPFFVTGHIEKLGNRET